MPLDPLRIKRFANALGLAAGRRYVFGALFALVIAASFLAYQLFIPAPGFEPETLYEVPAGTTIAELSDDLERTGLVRSSMLFGKLIVFMGKERGVIAGDYYFQRPQSLYAVARRITSGSHGMTLRKVTIPEGLNVREIGALFDGKFQRFDRSEFLTLAAGREGYLFPDTYFFMPNIRAQDVIDLLSANFENRTKSVAAEAASSSRAFSEIITMASIIEEEANGPEDRRIISGILWNRHAKKMPLQVDATLSYVTGRGSFELTGSDLRMNSPYNTYATIGLPPTPITNPGLDSIAAALQPAKTDYLFYLHDREGKVYYARDFEGHKRNRELYLGK